jgi:hypothetical protein
MTKKLSYLNTVKGLHFLTGLAIGIIITVILILLNRG